MASKLLLLLAINLLFLMSANACDCACRKCPTPTPPALPPPPPPSPTPSYNKCPVNTLKFGVCANVLGLVSSEAGKVPAEPCCSLLGGLADLEAAVRLCTAIKANMLGTVVNIPVKLSALVNYCGKCVLSGYTCV